MARVYKEIMFTVVNCSFDNAAPYSVSVSVQMWPIVLGIVHHHGIGLTLLIGQAILWYHRQIAACLEWSVSFLSTVSR